jgi:hypothetical protein
VWGSCALVLRAVADVAVGRTTLLAEREEIAVGLAADESMRLIARRLGCDPGTVGREVARNSDRPGALVAGLGAGAGFSGPASSHAG